MAFAVGESTGDGRESDSGATPVTAPLRRHRRSIRTLLSGASVLFLLLVIGLGAFSMQRLSHVNQVSDEIRLQWLQDVRLTGDLNNYMSDYRTGEGTHLLSISAAQLRAIESEIADLKAKVSRAQVAYEALPHEAAERGLYDEFAREWNVYLSVASRVVSLSRSDQKSEAITLYMTTSQRAFTRASDALGRLTEATVVKARAASARAAGTYVQDRRLIVAAMIVAACLMLTTIIYITRSISGPLLQLARGMQALAGHDTAARIPGLQRDDEIGEMARSVAVFRDNAVALVRSQSRLIEQTAALEETLENERRMTEQQRNFVTMTSHEFRTPLTVIDAQAQRLIKLKDKHNPADVLHRASRIRSAITRLTGIMDGLLGASQLLDGLAVYHPGEFDPASLLHEVCQLHRETTHDADISESYGELPDVMVGDVKLLFALFSNLLSNALKYSATGSPVELSAEQDAAGGVLIVTVRDHGMGIPERDQARLFERYFRGTNAARVAGSGVGLHLVAMVLETHHGTIDVDSREGSGSCFRVRLPLRPTNLSRGGEGSPGSAAR